MLWSQLVKQHGDDTDEIYFHINIFHVWFMSSYEKLKNWFSPGMKITKLSSSQFSHMSGFEIFVIPEVLLLNSRSNIYYKFFGYMDMMKWCFNRLLVHHISWSCELSIFDSLVHKLTLSEQYYYAWSPSDWACAGIMGIYGELCRRNSVGFHTLVVWPIWGVVNNYGRKGGGGWNVL